MLKEQRNKSNRVSLKDIAAALGISKGAVSLALNNSQKISENTKQLVKKTASKMEYHKSALLSNVMSSIKSENRKNYLETIVLINANRSKQAQEKYPIFSKYISGIKTEAEHLGYGVYMVWLHEMSLTQERLKEILESRAIRGGVIIGHADDNILPEKFSEIWKNFKFVSAGLRTANPIFDFISADKFLIAHHATTKVIKSGYKRPAIVMDEHIDELVEGRFIGGFLRAQLILPEKSRVPPFLKVKEARSNPKIFSNWLKKYNPDAIFSISSATNEWLESPKIAAQITPETNIIKLERKSDENDWIAIDSNYEIVGKLAVRKLFEILNAPTRLEDMNITTATIVQPRWNKNLDIPKLKR